MLAEDWDRAKVRFPVIVQPKIDGVRGLNINNVMSARTLRPFGNKYTNLFFSQHAFRGFDGELAAEAETHPRLCSLTSSATSTIEGSPWLMWHIFDFINEETIGWPYWQRLSCAQMRIEMLRREHPHLGQHLRIIPWVTCGSIDELDAYIEQHIDQGYEGTIFRAAEGKYKEGRSSPTQNGLLRIKPFITVDAEVTGIEEGQRNENEAKLNELGHTSRSTHAENMVPNGMVGAVHARLLEDAVFNKKVVHKKGDMVRFGAGRLTHDQRRAMFLDPTLIVGKRMKGQIFPYGIKDKPRFPTFQALRSDEDYVER